MMFARSALLTFSEKCDAEGFEKRAHGFGGLASHREAQAAEPRRDILGDLAAIAAAIGMGPVAIDAVAHARVRAFPKIARDRLFGASAECHRRRVDLALALHPQDEGVICRAAAHDAFRREGFAALSLEAAAFDFPPAIGSLSCG